MRHSRLCLAFALFFCGSACGAGGDTAAGKAHAAQSEPEARSVRLGQVSTTRLPRSVVVSGTLAADERVTMGTKVAGRVQSLLVDLGSEVREGDVLAKLEPTDFKLDVAQAESAVVQARAQLGLGQGEGDRVEVDQTSLVKEAKATLDETAQRLSRAQTLLSRKLIAEAEYDAIVAEHARAQSLLDGAREQIRTRSATLSQRQAELAAARQRSKDSVIRAPLDATVEERFTSVGEFLQVGAQVATLVRTSPLRLRLEIPEREAAPMRVGLPVRVRIEGDETVHSGSIARVSPTLRTDTRTLTVEAELPNEERLLRAGTFARAEILVEADAQALTVPKEAVVTFAGVDKVLTVEDGKAVEHTLVTGRRTDTRVEVLSGIEQGALVVLEPGNLQQGQPVRVQARP